MVLNPLSVNFDFEVLIQPDEADESVAAEDGHDRYVPSVFEALLKVFIRSRGMGCIRAGTRVAVKVGQELVAELFELNQQIMRRGHVSYNAEPCAALMRKFGPLVENQYAFDLRSGDEEELLVLVRSQLFEALVQEPGTDSVAFGSIRAGSIFRRDTVQAFEEIIGLDNVMDHGVYLVPAAHGFTEFAEELLALFDEGRAFLFKVSWFHCS